MHLITSIKQLWRESKANPAFTSLYVGGVTFAVAFTMLYAILYYVRIAPVYPEYNRDSTMYISYLSVRNDAKIRTMSASVGSLFIDEYLSRLENCEYFTVHHLHEPVLVQPSDGRADLRLMSSFVDPAFFRLYEYDFVAGAPFSQADYDAKVNVVVITDRVASALFGNPEDAIGRDISINYAPCRVRGVVREGSAVTERSYANIFRPLSLSSYISPSNSSDARRYQGQLAVSLKAKDPSKIPALKAEIDDAVRRINAADTDGWVLSVEGMPTNTEAVFESDGLTSTDFFKIIRPYIIILLVLLVIPALNISGMIGGQMGRRMAEMGLRRSFGADKRSLCRQVMMENFMLTLVGGIMGLVIAWMVLVVFQHRIFQLLSGHQASLYQIAPPEATGEMLFAPAVFIGTLVICIVLNVLSAYIPVKMALRRPIVSSLNQER